MKRWLLENERFVEVCALLMLVCLGVGISILCVAVAVKVLLS